MPSFIMIIFLRLYCVQRKKKPEPLPSQTLYFRFSCRFKSKAHIKCIRRIFVMWKIFIKKYTDVKKCWTILQCNEAVKREFTVKKTKSIENAAQWEYTMTNEKSKVRKEKTTKMIRPSDCFHMQSGKYAT